MSEIIPVALLGFSSFERSALESYFRVAGYAGARYAHVLSVDDARFVVADADQPGVAKLLHDLDRAADAVYVGAQSPPGASAWMMRPIDPSHVLRALDALRVRRDDPASGSMPLMPPPPAQAQPNPAPTRRADDAPPVRTAVEKRAAAERHRHAREAALRPMPLRRALLVDDSEIALHFLDRQLRHYGLFTEWAHSSDKALELLAKQAFGFVFLDIDLGAHSDLDGLALCQRIKRRHAHPQGQVPVVLLVSALHDATAQVRGTLAGADALLGKPLDLAALDRLMLRHGLNRQTDPLPTPPALPKRQSRPR